MDLTEEDFLAAIVHEEAFAHAVAAKPQGWYNLFYREKNRLLDRIRQDQTLDIQTSTFGGQDKQTIALAAEHARLEKVNDLISQAAALRETAPKVQQMIGDNKAQRVLGGEAPRRPQPSHKRSSSWQEHSTLYRTEEYSSSEDENEFERERLGKELAEGRRMIEDNLRRLIENESRAPPVIDRPRRPRSRTMESSPKIVRFDVPDARNGSIASSVSNSSGSSQASGGSQMSGHSYGSISSCPSDQEQPSKAMKMLGIGPKDEVRNHIQRPAPNAKLQKEKPRRDPKHADDPLVRFYHGR